MGSEVVQEDVSYNRTSLPVSNGVHGRRSARAASALLKCGQMAFMSATQLPSEKITPRTSRTVWVLLTAFFLLQLGIGVAGPLMGRTTDAEAYRRAGARLLATGKPYGDKELPYLYPPAVAVIFAPVAGLPPRAVATGWAAASAFLLTIAVARIAAGQAATVVLALVFSPFASTQWAGQANALVLLAIAAARPLLARREVAAGLAIGVSLALKPLAVPAAGGIALRGRPRAACVALAVALVSLLLVIPFGGSPVEAGRKTLGILIAKWPETRGADISLAATLDRLLGPEGAALRRQALRVVPFLILGAAVVRKLSPVATFDALLAGTLIAARGAWLHHATVLFPAVAAFGTRRATAVAVLFGIVGAWRTLGAGVGACGTIALALIILAPFTEARREGLDTS